jgi:DNA repair protein RecO
MTKELEGLVIRVIDYKESSLIMHLLTNSGIESILCKGVKKLNSKLKGYILSYNYVTCSITDGKMPILTDILLIESYINIQNNLTKNKYAGLIINMLYKEKYENNKVYELALKSIKFIDSSDEFYYYNLFILKHLYFMGIGLNMDGTKDNDITGYNINESSVSTKTNGLKADINKEELKEIVNLYLSKLETKIDCDLLFVNKFLKQYYLIHASMKI